MNRVFNAVYDTGLMLCAALGNASWTKDSTRDFPKDCACSSGCECRYRWRWGSTSNAAQNRRPVAVIVFIAAYCNQILGGKGQSIPSYDRL